MGPDHGVCDKAHHGTDNPEGEHEGAERRAVKPSLGGDESEGTFRRPKYDGNVRLVKLIVGHHP